MLNITKGNSIKLRAIFSIDDTPFHVVNSNDLSVRLVSMYRAYECPYRIDVAEDDILYITVPADVSVGVYGLEVKGKLNKMDWRTFTHEVLEITYETVQGDESAVVPASDAYDVKMEVLANKAGTDVYRQIADVDADRRAAPFGKVISEQIDTEEASYGGDVDETLICYSTALSTFVYKEFGSTKYYANWPTKKHYTDANGYPYFGKQFYCHDENKMYVFDGMKLKAAQIPAVVSFFDVVGDDIDIIMGSVADEKEYPEYEVVFSTVHNRFVYKTDDGKFYDNWSTRYLYVDYLPDDYLNNFPRRDVLYFALNASKLYMYDYEMSNELMPINEDLSDFLNKKDHALTEFITAGQEATVVDYANIFGNNTAKISKMHWMYFIQIQETVVGFMEVQVSYAGNASQMRITERLRTRALLSEDKKSIVWQPSLEWKEDHEYTRFILSYNDKSQDIKAGEWTAWYELPKLTIATATKAGLMPAYVDGVFDVNRYVGSTTPYDSLSQVLSNAATLIPTAVRRGGMSIKFIQSSDNKYVQYRLLTTYFSTNESNWQAFTNIDSIAAPFVYAISDNEDKILSYIDKDGYTHDKRVEAEDVTKFMEKTDGFPGNFHFGVSDGEDKIIFGVKNDGSLFSPWLDNQLKEAGQKASKIQNYTNVKSARLPIPYNIAQINVIKGFNESAIKTTWTFEYLDEYGNYFMKNASVKLQGRSSVRYPKHNWGLDLLNDDGSKFKLKLGNWLEMDSFHLKAYYIDVFVGQCDVAYKLMEDVYQCAQQKYKRPWGYLIDEDVTTTGASGNFGDDFNYTEPLAHPDGFPVKLYVNGEFYGVYAFNLKKDRNNYKMNKNNTSHILLDGVTDNRYMFTTNVGWSQLEVRNPKGLKDVNGNDYEEGAELSSTDPKSATVKASIERLNGFITAIKADTTKAVFEQYWNVPLMIDHYLVSQVIANFDDVFTHTNSVWVTYDGNIWSPTLYDCDSIFGQNNIGTGIDNPPAALYSATNVNQPYYYLVNLYRTELETRYKELRDKGIFTVEHISRMLQEWVDRIGNENIELNLDKWPEIPTYRASGTYTNNPTTGGCYNSVSRVEKWLASSIAVVDELLNYNI